MDSCSSQLSGLFRSKCLLYKYADPTNIPEMMADNNAVLPLLSEPVILANSCAETTDPKIIKKENHIPPKNIPESTSGNAMLALINRCFMLNFPET